MPTEKRKRKNSKQLRLSKQNELIAERLQLQYQLEKATTCDWSTFGNLLIQLGCKEIKKSLLPKFNPDE